MRSLSLAVLIVTISASSLLGEAREAPSTLQERRAAVETARRLEKEPLMPGAAGVRTELLRWWTEVPDLRLSWCAGVLLETKNKETSGIVLLQGIFGAGAFTIEHPDQAADQKAVTLAGIQSALRAYQAAIAQNPKLKDSFLDQLAEQVSSGVDTYLEKHLKDCKK
jgi:hypothetical protein